MTPFKTTKFVGLHLIKYFFILHVDSGCDTVIKPLMAPSNEYYVGQIFLAK